VRSLLFFLPNKSKSYSVAVPRMIVVLQSTQWATAAPEPAVSKGRAPFFLVCGVVSSELFDFARLATRAVSVLKTLYGLDSYFHRSCSGNSSV